jgi:hypothetical protein
MAKKVRRVRRVRRKNKKEELVEQPKAPEIPAKEELSEEYAYVIKDLRRVFILATLLFALLIALNLLLG